MAQDLRFAKGLDFVRSVTLQSGYVVVDTTPLVSKDVWSVILTCYGCALAILSKVKTFAIRKDYLMFRHHVDEFLGNVNSLIVNSVIDNYKWAFVPLNKVRHVRIRKEGKPISPENFRLSFGYKNKVRKPRINDRTTRPGKIIDRLFDNFYRRPFCIENHSSYSKLCDCVIKVIILGTKGLDIAAVERLLHYETVLIMDNNKLLLECKDKILRYIEMEDRDKNRIYYYGYQLFEDEVVETIILSESFTDELLIQSISLKAAHKLICGVRAVTKLRRSPLPSPSDI
jgi:hypothetical protein